MEVFFDALYAVVVFIAGAALGAVPGYVLGLALPGHERFFVPAGILLAVLGWIWAGWIQDTYSISRLGLVLFSAVGAFGFVQGWAFGLRHGADLRRRHAAR